MTAGAAASTRPTRGERQNPHPRQHHTHKAEHGEKGGREPGQDSRALRAWLDVVLGHEVRNNPGGLELLLAVCGGDADLLVKEVKVVVSHGHVEHPFHECHARRRNRCIQSSEYTSCPPSMQERLK